MRHRGHNGTRTLLGLSSDRFHTTHATCSRPTRALMRAGYRRKVCVSWGVEERRPRNELTDDA